MRPLVGGYIGLGVGLLLGLLVKPPDLLWRSAVPLLGLGVPYALASLPAAVLTMQKSTVPVMGLGILASLAVPCILVVAGVGVLVRREVGRGLVLVALVVSGVSLWVTHGGPQFVFCVYALAVQAGLLQALPIFGPLVLTGTLAFAGRADPAPSGEEGPLDVAPPAAHARRRGQF